MFLFSLTLFVKCLINRNVVQSSFNLDPNSKTKKTLGKMINVWTHQYILTCKNVIQRK